MMTVCHHEGCMVSDRAGSYSRDPPVGLARSGHLAALSVRADLDFFQRMNRRAIQHRAIDTELRAVARTIPATLERVPVEMAAEMRAGRRVRMHRAFFVAIRRNLLQ